MNLPPMNMVNQSVSLARVKQLQLLREVLRLSLLMRVLLRMKPLLVRVDCVLLFLCFDDCFNCVYTANAALKVSKTTKAYHKIRGMKRPKLKSLNIVKQLYKHTKSKKKKRHFSRNIKGKVIDGVSELYTLTAGMMLGLRCAVS